MADQAPVAGEMLLISLCRCGRSKYAAIVGTSVRDKIKEAIMANTTASAMGTKR